MNSRISDDDNKLNLVHGFLRSSMCEGGKISQEYAEFNKVKLFYLKNRSEIMLFVAVYTDRLSGGFGNQIEAITSALVFAMLTKSAFD